MKPPSWIAVGALLAGLGVGIGAFGAHGLSDLLQELHRGISDELLAKRLDQFDTGVRYHLWHALAIVSLGVAGLSGQGNTTAGWCFVAGIVLFSGLLYALAITGVKILGAIVPLGGLAFIAGWMAWAITAWRAK